MKQCTKCNTIKPLTEFYARRNDCKACVSARYHSTKGPLKGPRTYEPKPLPAERTCRICNQLLPISEFYVSKPAPRYKSPRIETRCKPCTRIHYDANKESILAKAASKRIPKDKPPKKTPKEIQARRATYIRERRRNNPVFKLRSTVGTSIANALAARGYKKTSKTCEILGCSFEEFKNHIERQFLPGMAWQNRSKWHIDHIVPVSFAISETEVLSLNHYSNLRPLWGVENQNKAARLTEESVNHSLYKTIIENRICDQNFCAQNFFLTVDPISESNNGTI
jgi:hypothetical protein